MKIIKNFDDGKTNRFNESRLSNYSFKSASKNKRPSSRPNTAIISNNKSRPITPQVRTLGTTRNQFYFPNENKEKELIQQYLWGDMK